MNQLRWITPLGNVANIGIGILAAIPVIAAGTTSATITYKIIGGELPTGMSMTDAGIITGTPTYTNPVNNYFSTLSFSFVVRASSSDGAIPIDGRFGLILTNEVNNDFKWVTPAGDLGTVPNGEFYQLPLRVTETLSNTSVTFSFVSGALPPGIQVAKDGYLRGVPDLLDAIAVDSAETFRFTVRATNSYGHVRDQAFSLTITNVFGPVIEPTTTKLDTIFDGTYYSRQLYVNELNPNVSITWSNIGSLPPGVTLDSTGLISGYVQPVQLVGDLGPAGFDGTTEVQGVITQENEYDSAPYDFSQLSQTKSYSFTVQAFDGANYDLQDYIVTVISRSGYTADNVDIPVDNTLITVDTGNVYIPVLLNSSITTLPAGRAGSYYSYKFLGYDFQGHEITYNLSNTLGTFDAEIPLVDDGFDYGSSDPEGIGYTGGGVPFDSFDPGQQSSTNLPFNPGGLDSATGWVYGKLNPQTDAYHVYRFGLYVSKTLNNNVYSSTPVYFYLPVFGNVNNSIEWVTPSNLGKIANGSVSELAVKAVTVDNSELVYSLVDQTGVPIRLPQGLELLPTGEISGRVSFEAFSVDDYTTTFDGNKLTIDRTYSFTVEARTLDGAINSTREFTVTLDIVDIEPYDNLYVRAMPTMTQRQKWNSIVGNTEIFDPTLIYRPQDPWFGVAKNIDMLFLPGLAPSELATYADAMVKNHYTKNYKFDGVKTAVVLDSSYNVKYEVVYVDVIDPALNSAGLGPPLEIDLAGVITNPYIDAQGNTYNVVYPNSTQNMIDRLVSGVTYYDQNSLPEWMTSNQLGATTGTFSTPLGFTRAVVLAYTVPGAGELVAYRLRNAGIDFNSIDFTIDRYLLDDYYTNNFDTVSKMYISGRETTFDALPNRNVGTIVATIDYAVTVPFSQINSRSVDYIIANGGIDGVTDFKDGDTLVFAKQEGFLNPGPYDGWIDYSDAFIGDNIHTPVTEGYGSDSYDTYTIIPGFFERAQGISATNQRGGVWKITIVNGIVSLTSELELLPNQEVRVLFGDTYSGAVLIYTIALNVGQTVPYYTVYKFQNGVVAKQTTFNGDTTKFFSHRDSYYTPGSNDKYIKFPQYGVFN